MNALFPALPRLPEQEGGHALVLNCPELPAWPTIVILRERYYCEIIFLAR